MARQAPSLQHGLFTSLLSCGLALRVYNSPLPVDLLLAFDEHSQLISAMPPDLFPPDLKDTLKAYVLNGVVTDHLYAASLATEYDVQCVPPKVDPSLVDDPLLRTHLLRSRDVVAKLRPVGIVNLNPGSNRGLVKILRFLQDEYSITSRDHYFMINADVDIFMRIIKVCLFFVAFKLDF